MKLVPAKCPSCGANLKVDPEKEAAICEYCHTPFIVEKAINNYNTTIINNNNFEGATVHIVQQHEDVAKLVEAAILANEAGDHKKADELADKILALDPKNYNASFIKFLSSNFTNNEEFLVKLRYGLRALNYCHDQKELEEIKYHSQAYIKQLLETHYPFIGEIFVDKRIIDDLFELLEKFGIRSLYRTVYLCAYEPMLFCFDGKIRCHVKKGENLIYLIISQNHDISSNYIGTKREEDFNIGTGDFDIYMTYKNGNVKFVSESEEKAFLEKTENHTSSGCFVATCVYGSYDCPQVWILRRYRDYYLDEKWWGKVFIKFYYAVSPFVVKMFGKTSLFNKVSRTILDKKIKKLLEKGYVDTPYRDKY